MKETEPIQVHYLKTWPEFFELVLSGKKTAEIREFDRPFRVNDILVLMEWIPVAGSRSKGKFTGRSVSRQLSQVLEGGQASADTDAAPLGFGLASSYGLLSFVHGTHVKSAPPGHEPRCFSCNAPQPARMGGFIEPLPRDHMPDLGNPESLKTPRIFDRTTAGSSAFREQA